MNTYEKEVYNALKAIIPMADSANYITRKQIQDKLKEKTLEVLPLLLNKNGDLPIFLRISKETDKWEEIVFLITDESLRWIKDMKQELKELKVKKKLEQLIIKEIEMKLKKEKQRKDNPPEDEIQYKKFKELFVDDKQYQICINALKKVTPVVVNDKMKFCLGIRSKGAVVAFIEVLKFRQKLYSVNDDTMAILINNEIKGLNIDERRFRDKDTTARNKYYNKFLALIS